MSENKYSKSELKARRTFRALLIFVSILLVLCICFFVFVVFKENIVFEKIDHSSNEITDDIAKNSSPVIINNALLGAVYNNTWVAPESYFFRGNKENIDIDLYNESGKKGTYKITEFLNADSSGTFYIKTNNLSTYEEFIAVKKNEKNIMQNPAIKEVNINDNDIKNVKKALGIYKIFNSTVKINSMHHVMFDSINRGYVVCVTNEVGKSTGTYSAVIYIPDNKKPKIIKYNYAKNPSKSPDWPIYSFKFFVDLNNDGKNEIILQETKEFSTKYDVIENRDGEFVEVMSTEIKSK